MSFFDLLYILAAALFILALKWMSSPATARRGVIIGEIGMLLAVVGTLLRAEEYTLVFIALAMWLRNRAVLVAVCLASLPFLLLFFAQFARWRQVL